MKKFTLFRLTLFGIIFLMCQSLLAQVSGTVFKDFNANGIKENIATYNEPGIAGVVVKAFDPSGAALAVTYTGGGTSTNHTGGYSVTGGTIGQIRLEFVMPDNFTFATSGSTGGTTVMFPTTATQDLAVNTPDDFWDTVSITDPSYIVPCYVQGGINSAYNQDPAIVSFKQSANSTNGTTTTSNGTFPNLNILSDKGIPCKIQEVGTVWGVAFDKAKQTYYMAAFAKRHSGDGPLGYGGIYILQKNNDGSYTKKTGINLQDVTASLGGNLDFGTITRNNIVGHDNEMSDAANTPSRDLDAYAKVGNMSYGDIDFFESGQKLFAINMKQQTLLEIDASTDLSGLSGSALGAKIKAYSIGNLPGAPTCTGGALKSWGLKIYKNKGYLGAVCDASTSQDKNDLKGYVLSFDPMNVSAGFTKVLDINLNYRDGDEDWKPWTSNFSQTGITPVSFGAYLYSEPAISDIEFDENGAMIIGLMNLQGHKTGFGNYYPISGNTNLGIPITHGDILHACYDATTKTWNLENTVAGCGPNFTEGYPGNMNTQNGYVASGTDGIGEYYQDNSGDGRKETVMGSFGKVMGTMNIISTVVDPYPANVSAGEGFWSTGGLHWYNVNSGTWTQQAKLFGDGWQQLYGKAFGLGDLEPALTNQPIEIGNRIWKDTDQDGIQDAGETGVDNVIIELYEGTTKVGTATSANGGQWYFNSTNVTGGLKPNTNYTIKVATALGSGALATCTAFTIKDATEGTTPDLIDADMSSTGEITLTTGSYGENNHSFDIGVIEGCTPPTAVTAGSNSPVNQGSAINLTSSSTGGTMYSWAGPNGFSSTTQNPTITSATSAMAGTYTVTVTSSGTCTATATTVVVVTPTCTPPTDVTAGSNSPVNEGSAINLTSSSTGGTVYSWTGPNGFSSTTQNPTITSATSAMAGTYTVTVTSSGTCTATATTVVVVTPTCTPPTDVTAGSNSPVNQGSAINLTSSSTGGTSYSWAGPNGFSSTTQNPTITSATSAMAGTYTVTVTSSGTCTATATTVVVVNNPQYGSIGNLVWKDTDNDGVQDTGESGVPNIKIYLLNASGTKIDSTTTNASGLYAFDSLTTGSYRVQIATTSLPADCAISTKQNQGTDDTKDNDFSSAGLSHLIMIDTSMPTTDTLRNNPNIDAALFTPPVDLALFKRVEGGGDCKKQLGDNVTFRIVVKRQDNVNVSVSGITVKDSMSAYLNFVSAVADKGTYDNTTKLWSGITLAKGDSAVLQITATIISTGNVGGLMCNEAWIQAMAGVDSDSQVGNKVETEDDFARACVSVPIKICVIRNEKVELTAPAGGTTYQWYKDGQLISGATSSTYLASAAGQYTVSVNNNQCSLTGTCCPIYIEDFCDCPPKICVPVTIVKTRSGN